MTVLIDAQSLRFSLDGMIQLSPIRAPFTPTATYIVQVGQNGQLPSAERTASVIPSNRGTDAAAISRIERGSGPSVCPPCVSLP